MDRIVLVLSLVVVACVPTVAAAQLRIAVLGAESADQLRLRRLGGPGREVVFVEAAGPELLASHRCDELDRECLARIALSFRADWVVMFERAEGELRFGAFDASPCRLVEPVRVADGPAADAEVAEWLAALDARIQRQVDRDAIRAAATDFEIETDVYDLPPPPSERDDRPARRRRDSGDRTARLIGAGIGGTIASVMVLMLSGVVVSSLD